MRLLTFVTPFLLGLLLAACGGEEEEGAPAAPATPTAAAPATLTPAPEGAVLEPSCQFPEDITSYRYAMKVKMQVPGPEGTAEAEEPLGELFGALSGLQDMEIEGAFVAPDRNSLVMKMAGEDFAEMVQIGGKSWVRLAGDDWTESEDASAAAPLTPEDLCQVAAEDLTAALPGLEAEKETVNDVKSLHYHLDKADLGFLALLFGGPEADEMLESFTLDIWLAEDGNWPVRMKFEASGVDEQERPVSFEMFMDFKDINEPDIEIEPPM